MNDIVTVLRQRARWCSHGNTGGPYDRSVVPWNEMTSCLSCVQELAAADEIERLRAAGDKVAMYLDAHYGQVNRPPSYVEAVLQEWQEARRG